MADGRLTHRKGKGYTRDLGWKVSDDGKRRQPRFLLGHDERTAKLANARLELLWDIIVRQTEQRNASMPVSMPPEEPAWNEHTLAIADAVRKGKDAIEVPCPEIAGTDMVTDAKSYVFRVAQLQDDFGSVINFIPQDRDTAREGRDAYGEVARHRARQARERAQLARIPIPDTGVDQHLHQAIEAYAACAERSQTGGANEPQDARSLVRAVPDRALSEFGYDAIEAIGTYWMSRPPSQAPGANGKPIAVNTVNNRLKTTRRFIRWLHRSDAWNWRAPDEWEEAVRFNLRRVQTEEELLQSAEGPDVWHIDELQVLYKVATDRERCLLLMGLNLGFAQSEIVSFRTDDIKLNAEPPQVNRVRRKTGKAFAAKLWPQTIQALHWLEHEVSLIEPPDNPWVLLTENGNRPTSQHIANRWNRLLDRARQEHPDIRRLSFKFLRKTAYQMVLEASGSAEVAGTFQARSQLTSDEFSDVYGRRLYDRVFQALDKVHERLQPMFAEVPEAFKNPKSTGSPNIPRKKIEKIQRLHQEGVTIAAIAKAVGCSRPTVYRWIKQKT